MDIIHPERLINRKEIAGKNDTMSSINNTTKTDSNETNSNENTDGNNEKEKSDL
jgi:hypothetical protein